jgi:hypothetical protein
MSPASLTLTALLADVSAHDLTVMDAKSSGTLPNGLFNDHASIFEGVAGTGASAAIKLGVSGLQSSEANPADAAFQSIAEWISTISLDIGGLASPSARHRIRLLRAGTRITAGC